MFKKKYRQFLMTKNIKRIGILTGGGAIFKTFLDCRKLPGFKLRYLWNNVKSLRCRYRMCWNSKRMEGLYGKLNYASKYRRT